MGGTLNIIEGTEMVGKKNKIGHLLQMAGENNWF